VFYKFLKVHSQFHTLHDVVRRRPMSYVIVRQKRYAYCKGRSVTTGVR